ncbi:MAG: CYTH domain-containing protein [Victivallaceae bacterium]|nr:CYTH domain-containing protein [Victivallaceae bacterium]
MGVEIERKFLVDKSRFEAAAAGIAPVRMIQGYMARTDRLTARVRVAGRYAYLTLKGPITGLSRSEYEYEIPVSDAENMLAEFCGGVVEKSRYEIPFADHIWEVDVFEGANAGLIVAEVELESEADKVELPDFVTEEVTGKRCYYNGALSELPFSRWNGSRECSPQHR